MVRLFCGQGTAVTSPEQSGLREVGQLARRRDWAGLWRLVLGMPLADAAAAMPAFGDGWRPSDDQGRLLFGRLASADPDSLALARDAFGGAGAARVPVHGLALWCAFSPDGRQLVILSIDAGLRSGEVCVVRLPGGAVVDRQEIGFYPLKVLHLGDAILVSGETVTGDRRHDPAAPDVLMRLAGGRAEPVLMPGNWGGLRYHPCGFALHGGSRADGSRLLRLCAPDSEVIRDIVGGDLLLAQTAGHLWSYRLVGGRLKGRARAKNLALGDCLAYRFRAGRSRQADLDSDEISG
jgi:hypothetical protein